MKSVSASEFLEAVLESRRTNDEPTVICPSGHITLDDTRHGRTGGLPERTFPNPSNSHPAHRVETLR